MSPENIKATLPCSLPEAPCGDTSRTASHTRGPWQLLPEEFDKPYVRVRGTALGGRYKIANVLAVGYANAPQWEAEETRANARLIAAAPELLAALQLLHFDIAECARISVLAGFDSPAMRGARAAIAAALAPSTPASKA